MAIFMIYSDTDQGDRSTDQGDRSLIFYFERGREFGVRATSVFSCAINPLKILPYFIYDSIGQSADTNHLTWTCSKSTHHVTDTRGTVPFVTKMK